MESFRVLFVHSGVYGILILAATIICSILLLVVTIIIKKTKSYIYTIVFVMVPILIGITGTIMGRLDVARAIENSDEVLEQHMIDSGYEVAWASTELGLKFALPLFLFFIISFLYKKRKNKVKI